MRLVVRLYGLVVMCWLRTHQCGVYACICKRYLLWHAFTHRIVSVSRVGANLRSVFLFVYRPTLSHMHSLTGTREYTGVEVIPQALCSYSKLALRPPEHRRFRTHWWGEGGGVPRDRVFHALRCKIGYEGET